MCDLINEVIEIKSPSDVSESSSSSSSTISVLNEGAIHKEFYPILNKKQNGSILIEVPYFEKLHYVKASYKFIDTNPKIESTSQCSDTTPPIIQNFCRISCVNFGNHHVHFLCFICEKVQKGTFANSTSGMLLHNSLHHNELKLTKNQRIIRLEDSQKLDYTQGSLYIALDIRDEQVEELLDLKNLKGTLSPSSIKSLYIKESPVCWVRI